MKPITHLIFLSIISLSFSYQQLHSQSVNEKDEFQLHNQHQIIEQRKNQLIEELNQRLQEGIDERIRAREEEMLQSEEFLSQSGSVIEQDSLALVDLYNSTDGPNWTDNTNWLEGPVHTWHGITVSNERVIVINLLINNLKGPIPSSIGSLTNLEELILIDNPLSGSLPPELGKLLNLKTLVLAVSEIHGSIPSELGNLTNLEVFSLTFNELTGSIPPELGYLTNLTNLLLDSNDLSGSIPIEFSNFTNLEVLSAFDNNLDGTIPSELGSLTNLRYLNLEVNELTGSIPQELGNLTQLESLRLDGNKLINSIPAELGNLINLKSLILSLNNLDGMIPPHLGKLSNLEILNLHRNDFKGPIPLEFKNLKNLEKFRYNDTDLCIPDNEDFQQWLSEIDDLQGTGVICEDIEQPKLAISPSEGKQLEVTFEIKGGNFTPEGEVHRFVKFPDEEFQQISSITADQEGNVQWNFSPDCDHPVGDTHLFAVDAATEVESNEIIQQVVKNDICDRLSAFDFNWPVNNPYIEINDYSKFNNEREDYHTGIDIHHIDSNGIAVASPVYSIADGYIENLFRCNPTTGDYPVCEGGLGSENDNFNMQNIVIIKHELPTGGNIYNEGVIFSLYAHLSEIDESLEEGDKIKRGSYLGHTGITNRQENILKHVHLEIKMEPVANNPFGDDQHWGYTPQNPDDFGFLNPWIFIHPIEGLSQYSGSEGTEISLNGQLFNSLSDESNSIIYFGDEKADIVSYQDTQIQLLVPAGSDTVHIRLEPTKTVEQKFLTTDVSRWLTFDYTGEPVSIDEPNNNIPTEYTLLQNYPNPFNPITTIRYSLPERSDVRLEVFDLLGRRMATLVDEQLTAGYHEAQLDASNFSSGIYIYVFETHGFREMKKMTLIK